MASPTAPVARVACPPSQPWRPRSQPAKTSLLARTIQGMFNKVTISTVGGIGRRFAELVVHAERVGDSVVIALCAELAVQRCVADPMRMDLIAETVERPVNEAECEGLRCRRVNSYQLANPVAPFHFKLRRMVLDSVTLASLPQLIVSTVLVCEDVHELTNMLFMRTTNNSDLYCVVLYRMLRQVLVSTEAPQIIDGLSLVSHVESVLEEDTISLKIRYMLMGLLDQCLYPRPEGVFSSGMDRSEAYGFLDDGDNITGPQTILEHKAETIVASLPCARRWRFTQALISAVLAVGDEADVHFVATLPSQPENEARDRLLNELASLTPVAAEGLTFPLDAIVEETSEDEASALDYAYAY
ncbi:hypothetical protein BD414DRAFT_517674 [Trametes punicea]|nr:hypothetical protein BD414DRAFT_517674 [Trametes punicea]